ncbi:MAG: SPOR domain-containing protein [Rhodocyclaceae bacterium]|nr:SPOR domain-containing protein [Rhodocyclaceae bacterium]MBX3668747.1 SPOR domain-containing protein [Rhodocyclaceae bacterium]
MKREKPARAAPPRGNHGGTLTGIFIGLVLGLMVAAGVTWYVKGGNTPFLNRDARPASAAADSKGADKPPQVATLPGKPGEKPGEKQRFDFYNILPGGNSPGEPKPGAAEPKSGAADQKPAPVETRTPAPVTKPAETRPEPMFLQAGAFSSAQDADNLKARLALMGLDVQVAQATVPDKGLLFRVRVGPFRSAEDAGRVRTELAEAGIAASVVKP